MIRLGLFAGNKFNNLLQDAADKNFKTLLTVKSLKCLCLDEFIHHKNLSPCKYYFPDSVFYAFPIQLFFRPF